MDREDLLGLRDEALIFEKFHQALAVDAFDRNHALAAGIGLGIGAEAAGGDEDALLDSPGQRDAELADAGRSTSM
ncbi:hypothetical protein [Aquimonas voraii]|uniref:hypothetical protein n=1 Tax=Aquimonas voraii TaxID=265719 RepID=UPI000B8102F4|nr:hypothetical protein [Aquimonas voraii]